jgi:hypothetical protein
LAVVALLARALPADAPDPTPWPGGLSPVELSRVEREFLEKHWRRTVPPQGPAPSHYTFIERSLQPEACGGGHPVQFGDWQASLHSSSMGPGVAGQLVEMTRREPAAARSCSRCHALVAKQRPELVEARGAVANPDVDNALRNALRARGVICASCHQFGADGLPLNCKPLENTYERWRREPGGAPETPVPELPHARSASPLARHPRC